MNQVKNLPDVVVPTPKAGAGKWDQEQQSGKDGLNRNKSALGDRRTNLYSKLPVKVSLEQTIKTPNQQVHLFLIRF